MEVAVGRKVAQDSGCAAQTRAIVRTCFFRKFWGGGHAATCILMFVPQHLLSMYTSCKL